MNPRDHLLYLVHAPLASMPLTLLQPLPHRYSRASQSLFHTFTSLGAPLGPGEVKGGCWGPLRRRNRRRRKGGAEEDGAGDGDEDLDPGPLAMPTGTLSLLSMASPTGSAPPPREGEQVPPSQQQRQEDMDDGWLSSFLNPAADFVGIDDTSVVTMDVPLDPEVFRIVEAADASNLESLVDAVMVVAEVEGHKGGLGGGRGGGRTEGEHGREEEEEGGQGQPPQFSSPYPDPRCSSPRPLLTGAHLSAAAAQALGLPTPPAAVAHGPPVRAHLAPGYR